MTVEGVKDLCAVMTGSFDNRVTLQEYFASKMLSYAVNIVTMGWDNFKRGIEAVKASATVAATGLKNITLQALGKEVVQQEVLAQATKNIAGEAILKSALENYKVRNTKSHSSGRSTTSN